MGQEAGALGVRGSRREQVRARERGQQAEVALVRGVRARQDSATGDPTIDAALPLAERYDIPAATVRAVFETRARGGCVVAVGTTVVRALEGASLKEGGLRPGAGETDLIISPSFRPRVVDGILSGAHAAHESHFSLLAAFAGPALLTAAAERAERAGFLTHELGDSMLVLPGALAPASVRDGLRVASQSRRDA